MAYSRIRFEIQNSATMTLVQNSFPKLNMPVRSPKLLAPKLILDFAEKIRVSERDSDLLNNKARRER